MLTLERVTHVYPNGTRALDDVTLSGANLALLTRCKFDMIKIEGSLIAQLAPGDMQPAWLAGLQTLLQTATALQVIAEGVETAHQAEVLRAAGVQMAQGHHFSAPMPAAAYKRYYAATRGTP